MKASAEEVLLITEQGAVFGIDENIIISTKRSAPSSVFEQIVRNVALEYFKKF